MEAAERLGVSLRRFDGWEPTEVTEHEYDDAGRLVRSVSRRESEFDEEDRGWFLALALCRRLTCAGCGHWLPESTSTATEDYQVDAPYRCGACTMLAMRQEQHSEKNQHMHATRWTVERRR